MMIDTTFLGRIVAATRTRLIERVAAAPPEQVRREAARQPPALDFAAALRPTDGGVRAIAEIKRASPSKGPLNLAIDPVALAAQYADGGAAAISVLTEQDHFQGSLDDLLAVKQARRAAGIPVLRKDFITDAYQIVEARAAGADSVLLIVALLGDAALAALLAEARRWGMEPLVEVHDAAETRRAVAAGAQVIGVNARDLRTFQVDTALLARLRPLIPADRVVVAESGIQTLADVARLRGFGAQAILVGEALVRAAHPAARLLALTRLPPALRLVPPRPGPVVKLCGLRTPADAWAAYTAGADLLGLVCVPGTQRAVTTEQARAITRALPDDALPVGVFANLSPAAVADAVAATGIRIAQIAGHQGFGPEDFDALPVPVIMTKRTLSPWHPDTTVRQLALLDSAPPGSGGTGIVGDWPAAAARAEFEPLLLAGGLTPANVSEAIRAVRPWGVDVSSGIEGPDGQKDPARMRAFVQAVRGPTNTDDTDDTD